MELSLSSMIEHTYARLHRPVVSVEEYRAISCNRCGVCCEDIRAELPPEQIQAEAEDSNTDPDRRALLSGLEAVGPVQGGWRYRCQHFARDEEGLGLCTIFETRPNICRGFPYGHVVRSWAQCSWNVEVRGDDGTVLTIISPVPSVAEQDFIPLKPREIG